MPGIAEEVQAAVRSMGRRLRIIRIPSDAASNGLTIPQEIMKFPKAVGIFRYLVIMLYKNVTKSNFREFSVKRFKALRAVAGDYRADKEYVSVFNDVEDAICYRNTYGHNYQIRKAVLSAVLGITNDSGPFINVRSYVANFLSWTDMRGYCLVHDFLVYADSPVLKAPELATEVSNWKKANQAVEETNFPEYFRILEEDPTSCSTVKRSNFPTLIAIAEKIENGGCGSNKVNAERSEVDYYVDMDAKYNASGKLTGAIKRDIDFLTHDFVAYFSRFY